MKAREMINEVAQGGEATKLVKSVAEGTLTEEKHFVVVKGSEADLKKAAAAHNLKVIKTEKSKSKGEIFADVEGSLKDVINWMADGKQAPYPPGTLLFHR